MTAPKVPYVITHAPGHMVVTGVPDMECQV